MLMHAHTGPAIIDKSSSYPRPLPAAPPRSYPRPPPLTRVLTLMLAPCPPSPPSPACACAPAHALFPHHQARGSIDAGKLEEGGAGEEKEEPVVVPEEEDDGRRTRVCACVASLCVVMRGRSRAPPTPRAIFYTTDRLRIHPSPSRARPRDFQGCRRTPRSFRWRTPKPSASWGPCTRCDCSVLRWAPGGGRRWAAPSPTESPLASQTSTSNPRVYPPLRSPLSPDR